MLKLLLTLLVLVGGFWTVQRLDFFAPPPCTKPITYHLGTFDRRFGLEQKDFISALTEAEQIWEGSWGKELFSYDAERGRLAVNLVYDYRQEVTDELSVLESSVKGDESTYRALERDYKALKATYAQAKIAYDSAVLAFGAHQSAYEAQVAEWNHGPRRSESEFQALEQARLALSAELSTLKERESQVNTMVKELNAMVSRLNTLAKTLNLNAEEYNAIGASRGETFTGGLYTSDASGERIDIFEFSNHQKLVRVLAHELGHALGLDHLFSDKNAIMYESNIGTSLILNPADLAALRALCTV